MLEFLFNMWRWILAFSAATGVITGIFALVRFIKSRGGAIGPGSSTLTLIVALAACTLVLMSLAVGMLFAEVPQICGGTVNEAYRELNAVGLTLALEKEIKLDENWSKEVIGQSIECHSVVRKGTQVVAYLKKDLFEKQDETTAPQTEPKPFVAPTPETTVPQKPPIVGEIGSIFTYGSYEQDGFSSDGREPIEWVVLDKADGKALLLSNQAMDCVPYNNQDVGCTWATCSLRKWLNDTFYEKAFSTEEREWILKSRVAAHANPDYSTNPGRDIDDYIFLLSVDEVKYYFPYNSDRMCSPTEHAVKQGAFRKESLGTCWWWLRTPGKTSRDASSISSDGTIDTGDGSVNSGKGCVRPAMWVRIGD